MLGARSTLTIMGPKYMQVGFRLKGVWPGACCLRPAMSRQWVVVGVSELLLGRLVHEESPKSMCPILGLLYGVASSSLALSASACRADVCCIRAEF